MISLRVSKQDIFAPSSPSPSISVLSNADISKKLLEQCRAPDNVATEQRCAPDNVATEKRRAPDNVATEQRRAPDNVATEKSPPLSQSNNSWWARWFSCGSGSGSR
ncbi:uncharacterized protein LOC133718444 isoform X2 [Rosa rugosa]|uniref:uncharacterized protein LOC133718444 isoform X2 n=1 Tax=Rosa rugosa TaxID=74645 RepID=UPI002B40F0C6|nr:uncharacterized protein LOC133718444 isoform X2 [Rosa rugosa]XP_062001266.1 uncharacterized protein LOC133718444 isoform X2 [Rosa rugosa]XP_062001267.1 uncharacterized protein LOC133718444 isoform X2 [Rosa rugosa]XP_062001268.1 uncharacterized protein LOC133718444 isoform X2 [Rosa rugosa]